MMQMMTLPLGALQTNCYLVWGEGSDTCLVIDPGDEPEKVLLAAKKIHKSIEAILLTHGHFDHVGAVQALRDHTGCAVYLCPEDLTIPHRFTAGPLHPTHTYTEGDILNLADLELRVLHTPGHTPGSVCLAVEDTLFSGDTLFQNCCGRTDLPGGSWEQIRKSLKRLAEIETDYRVYPGHGPATTLAEEKRYNPYMQ